MNRREFVQTPEAVETILAITHRHTLAAPGEIIPYRWLGRTGEKVSIIGIGGAHLGKPEVSEALAVRIVRAAMDGGVNFLDNSWDYNGGESEIRMGKALRDGYRSRAFLMTKVDGRTAESASSQLDESLKRLAVDHVDLLQIHEVIRMEDVKRVFADGGTIEALVKARETGKIRYLGFTGHKSPAIHLRMLEEAGRHGFSFDTIQMPLNVMDAHFDSFGNSVLPLALDRGIGVLGMKSMGDPIILDSKTVTPIECLRFTMNLPVSVCITGIDSMETLRQALETARELRPMSREEIRAILDRTEEAARDGSFEPYKTGDIFDSTEKNPEWLGLSTLNPA